MNGNNRIYTGLGQLPDRPVALPRVEFDRATDPAGYRADPELIDAVNVALMLRQPLLVTGEPGTGKTQLAAAIAHELGLGTPLRFDTKSTSRARDLFYTYDALGHFQASQNKEDARGARDFITFNALGVALIRAANRSNVASFLPVDLDHDAPQTSVVLIDEIDKAPRDFPNDLLAELEEPQFRIAELSKAPAIQASPDLRPIIVLTSNSEKHLPDAFLRRCVYYHIQFPQKRERLAEILASRIGAHSSSDSALVSSAIDLFYALRSESLGLGKKPATAELISWIQVLVMSGAVPSLSLRKQRRCMNGTLGVLIKSADDVKRANPVVEAWLAEQNL